MSDTATITAFRVMATGFQMLSPSKNVLQQTNNNIPVIVDPRREEKEKEIQRRKRRLPQETENRGVSKLPRVRYDVSSQKLNVQNVSYPTGCYRGNSEESGEGEDEDEEEEEEEEELETKPRKPSTRPIIPNYVTKNDEGHYRKRRKSRGDAVDLSSHGEERAAASISIAKRNARERNRVKLVNQGFATLRSRIPDYISQIYTEERKKKKVSKVETLRMALGYIRHLTEMLELRTTADWFDSSPGNGVYLPRESALYEYHLEGAKELPGKVENEEPGVGEEEREEGEGEGAAAAAEDGSEYGLKGGKDSLLLPENAFSVSVGCCFDIDKPEVTTVGGENAEKSPLPSMNESFPKKNLRAFYQGTPFLTDSSQFHV